MSEILECSLRFMEDLSRDRKRGMAEELSVDDVERMLLVLQQGGLEKLVRSAHEALRRVDGYRSRGVDTPSSAGLSQAIAEVLSTPGNLRSTRVVSETISSLAHRLRGKVPGSQKFGSSARRGSISRTAARAAHTAMYLRAMDRPPST